MEQGGVRPTLGFRAPTAEERQAKVRPEAPEPETTAETLAGIEPRERKHLNLPAPPGAG